MAIGFPVRCRPVHTPRAFKRHEFRVRDAKELGGHGWGG